MSSHTIATRTGTSVRRATQALWSVRAPSRAPRSVRRRLRAMALSAAHSTLLVRGVRARRVLGLVSLINSLTSGKGPPPKEGWRRRRGTETERPGRCRATRQQATAPQPATRPQEGEGGGGESCEKGREAKPHRDEHQEQATARGAEPKIPSGKLELRVPQGATPVNLRMQALTAARFDDILYGDGQQG